MACETLSTHSGERHGSSAASDNYGQPAARDATVDLAAVPSRPDKARRSRRRGDGSLVISELTLRKAVGLLGVALPVILALGCWLRGGCTILESSISAYYGTTVICAAGCCTIALVPQLHLFDRVKGKSVMAWYARQTIEHGWSRNVLLAQIETRPHERAGKALTNFKGTLAPPRSDLAQQTLKDPYVPDVGRGGERGARRGRVGVGRRDGRCGL